jgi:hypothetical protein
MSAIEDKQFSIDMTLKHWGTAIMAIYAKKMTMGLWRVSKFHSIISQNLISWATLRVVTWKGIRSGRLQPCLQILEEGGDYSTEALQHCSTDIIAVSIKKMNMSLWCLLKYHSVISQNLISWATLGLVFPKRDKLGLAPALPSNVRRGRKRLTVTNTLAYYNQVHNFFLL